MTPRPRGKTLRTEPSDPQAEDQRAMWRIVDVIEERDAELVRQQHSQEWWAVERWRRDEWSQALSQRIFQNMKARARGRLREESSRFTEPKATTLEFFVRAYGINGTWLLTGEGERYTSAGTLKGLRPLGDRTARAAGTGALGDAFEAVSRDVAALTGGGKHRPPAGGRKPKAR